MRVRVGAALAAAAVLLLTSSGVDAAAAAKVRAPAKPATPRKVHSLTAKDIKKKGMDHPAFENAGAHKGLEIWRIENFEPVPVAKSEFGKFYTGDSYIVLNTKEDGRKKLSWDIHFWLGAETTQDELGTAAMLTVALDEKLGGGPIEYRETQGYESSLFSGLFKPAIRYLSGGHASGFTHVTVNAGSEKRMFQVKGKKNIRVRQVDPSVAAMNKGDCFILDVGHNIHVYVGPKAKRVEKLKAISAANQIRDQDHSGRAKIDIIDEFSSDFEFDKFFTALGSGTKDTVPEETAGGDDSAFEKTEVTNVSLYKISDESGVMQAIPIAKKPFKQEDLNENDCFVLDTVSGGLYVWVGKHCNAKERAEVMVRAQQYLKSRSYPAWVQVTRVPQGAEPAAFKQYFAAWKDQGALHSRLIRATSDEEMYASDQDVANAKIKKVVKSGSARGFMPDSGDGHAIIYRVEDMELVKVADSKDPEHSTEKGSRFGEFYQGDSYIIKYSYTDSNGDTAYIIGFWLGKDSTQDEQAAAAMHTVVIDNELGGKAVQVRIPQGEEPKHFLQIFQGKLITHLGGHGSAFKGLNQNDSYDTDGTRLYRIQGNDHDMRAEQVPEVAASLSKDDAFLLETPENIYGWIGNESSDEEKEAVKEFSGRLFGEDKTPVILMQGEEPSEFWTALGGFAGAVEESALAKQRKRLRVGRDPHLVQVVVNFIGKVTLQEIGGYQQQDLDDDAIFIMDSGEEIYVWVGNQATQREKDATQKAVIEYLRTDPSDRSPQTVVVIVAKQGHEPEIFKRLFDEWDNEYWKKQMSYDEVKSKMIEMNEVM